MISNKDICEYFDAVVNGGATAKLAANWVLVDVQAILNKEDISIKAFKVSPNHLADLIKLIEKGTVSNKQAREIFLKMLENDDDPNKLVKDMGTTLLSDEGEIQKIINQVLEENPQSIIDYKNGKDRAVGFLVGQVMKSSHGKANPAITNRLIVEELKRR